METCDNPNCVKMNFPKLQTLVDNRVLSHIMARQLQGVNFNQFKPVHNRNSMFCLLRSMLKLSGSQSKKLIKSVVAYFSL